MDSNVSHHTSSNILTMPQLDMDALDKAIAVHREKKKDEGVQIRTRSQVMLEEGLQRAKNLENERAAVRKDIKKLSENIAELQLILEQLQAAENDLSIQTAVIHQSNHSLQQAGITL